MARGNQGRAIYTDDLDRTIWMETLAEACEKTGWRVHAYVLMGNHYHTLLETPEANLVPGMKWLQGTYTQRYNSRHEVFGHLFQGRYKALLVDEAEGNYFEVVSTYIHLNPARAGLIRIGKDRLKRFGWSSYPWYLNRAGRRPVWLSTEKVMGSLGLRPTDRRGYEAYLEGRVLELASKAGRKELDAQWKALRRGWYVGRESFLEKLEKYLDGAVEGRRRESHSGQAKTAHDEAAAEKALRQALKALGLDESDLAQMAKSAAEKLVLAWWLRQRTTVGLRWVSERLRMGHFTRVSQAVSLVQRQPEPKHEKLKRQLTKLTQTKEIV
jgi:REP element-mobilizing transposase RayT